RGSHERPEAGEDLNEVLGAAVDLHVPAAQVDLRDCVCAGDRAVDVGQNDVTRCGELVGQHPAARADVHLLAKLGDEAERYGVRSCCGGQCSHERDECQSTTKRSLSSHRTSSLVSERILARASTILSSSVSRLRFACAMSAN